VSDESGFDYLSAEDLIEIAAGVIEGDVVVRDHGLLASAAARPRTSAFGRDAYPEFADQAAALMHSLARNHALIDGNKRLAWAATRVFCLLNGRDLRLDVDQAEATVVAAARGDLDAQAMAAVLRGHLIGLKL
jgi:death on curing protein